MRFSMREDFKPRPCVNRIGGEILRECRVPRRGSLCSDCDGFEAARSLAAAVGRLRLHGLAMAQEGVAANAEHQRAAIHQPRGHRRIQPPGRCGRVRCCGESSDADGTPGMKKVAPVVSERGAVGMMLGVGGHIKGVQPRDLEEFGALQVKWGGLCTKHHASKMSGLSDTWIRQLCANGRIEVVSFMGTAWVSIKSFARYRATVKTGAQAGGIPFKLPQSQTVLNGSMNG
jgi:hypothetical protein